MANRDVTVRLRAEIGNFEAAMKRSSEAAKAVGASAKTAGNDVDIFGNQLTDADKVAGRYINAAGRVVEANGKFAAGFDRNTEAAKAYRAELNAQLSPMDRLAQLQRENEQAWSTLSTTAMVAGGSMVAAVGSVVAKYASFDKAMSAVQASTHASGVEMEQLRELAMRAGADTAYSGEEAAAGINELAKAGVSTNDILRGGLTGALSLAAAGEIEVGDAAELAATAMTQFKLEGKDLGHVADLLAAGAGKAQGSVGDLGYALKQSGLVASQAGISIEETVGSLAAFASAGLVGSDAGTSFKVMLQKLQNPSKEAQQTLDELGVSMYDSQGNFVGMVELADQLKTSMQDLTPAQRDAAMATIFGSDAVRAANVLYAQGGAGIQDWINKVNDAGYAAETAAALQDNLAGDLEKLGGAFDTLALQSGGSLNDMFRDIVQGATDMLELVGQIPGPVLTTTAAIVGLGGAGLLTVGGIMKGVAAVAEFKDAADDLGLSLPSLDGKMGKIAGTATAVGAAFAALAIAGQLAGSGLEKLGDATEYATALKILETDAEAGVRRLNELSTASGSAGTSVNGLGDALETVNMNGFMKGLDFVGSGFGNFDSDVKLAEEALKNFDAALATTASTSLESAAKGFQEFKTQAENSGMSLEQAAAAVPGYANALRDLAAEHGVVLEGEELYQAMLGNLPPKLQEAQTAAEGATEGMGVLGEGMGQLGEVTGETAATFDELLDALTSLGLAYVSQEQAIGAYYSSIEEMQAQIVSLAESQTSLGDIFDASTGKFNQTTEAGRATSEVFYGLRQAGLDAAAAMASSGATHEELTGQLMGTYNQLYNNAIQLGLTSEQADILTRAVLDIPDEANIETYMSEEAKKVATETTTAVDGVPDGTHTDSSMSSAARDMANDTTGAVNAVPDSHFTDLTAGSQARDMANQTRDAIVNIPLRKGVTIEVNEVTTKSTLFKASGAGKYTGGFASPSRGFFTGGLPGTFDSLRRYASGGLLPGVPPASPTMDNLPGYVADTGEPVLLRSREYIVNEPSTWRGENLSWLRWMNAGGTMPTPAPRGFAVGGSPAALPAPVAPAQPASSAVTQTAVNAALDVVRGMRPSFTIDGYTFYGVMESTNRKYGGL